MSKTSLIHVPKVFVAIIIFITFYCAVILVKPDLMFHKNGDLRDFGLGSTAKTPLPLWLIVIILVLFSYGITNFLGY